MKLVVVAFKGELPSVKVIKERIDALEIDDDLAAQILEAVVTDPRGR